MAKWKAPIRLLRKFLPILCAATREIGLITTRSIVDIQDYMEEHYGILTI